MLAGKVLEDEKWVAHGDASISRGDKICNSSSGRVCEWVLDAVLVHFLERVVFLTDLSLCAHRTISKITERANRDGVCLSLSHGTSWHSKIDLVESGLFGELGKLDATSSDGCRFNQVAGGENWLGGSRSERNLGRRVLLGGAIPACGIDSSLFFFSLSSPRISRISCIVRRWLQKGVVVASILVVVVFLGENLRLEVSLTLSCILRIKRVVSIGATRCSGRDWAVPVLGFEASLAR